MANKPKMRITLNLDVEIVEYFKRLGIEEDRPYQPIMNRVLREYLVKQVTKSTPTAPNT